MDDLIHVGAARRAVLTANLGGTTADLTITCDDLTGWPLPTGDELFVLIINKTGATPEKILCSGRSGNIITVWSEGLSTGRAYDGTTIAAHQTGEYVEHVWTAGEANALVDHVNSAEAHDADGDIVGQNTLDEAVGDLTALISASAALAIPKSIIDATGDLIYGTANDTPARRSIGDEAQVLTVTGGVPTWEDTASGLNPVFEVSVTADSSESLPNSTFEAGKDYVIELVGSSSAGGETTYRMRLSGTDASGPNYGSNIVVNAASAVANVGQTSGRLVNTSTQRDSQTFTVYRPADAVNTVLTGTGITSSNGGAFPNIFFLGGEHLQATAYDAMTFFWSQPWTGTIRVWELAP